MNTFVLYLMLAILGIIGAEGWEHRPAGAPAIPFIGGMIPESLAAQRDGYRADYATERQSFATLRGAIVIQNAAVLSLKSTGDRWQAQGRVAVAQAVKANAWRLADARRILDAPEPVDQSQAGLCKAAEAVLREAAR
jgi:hypothetical protein